ncbi:DUF4192 family protein [Amnibacterium sp. CER49]|uniref:DUF4192 family protein n=1 Tax=Amnibacterium sp. CER49 TaxID=3039161 RepID=UPI00244C6547|nr:DUF4192 family protein [Amnibacterium sp. CER49]MDH2445036.1 DUF4192 family protein [Amnibacterium sp. CER49]
MQHQHPDVVRADDAAAFLGLVPALTGGTPQESLVLVAFTGRRTAGALRLDLPVSSARGVGKRFATTAVGMLCKVERVDGVVPVVYTGLPFARAPWPLLERVASRAREAGLDVRDLLVVAADGWGSLLDPAQPVGGRPLAEIGPTPQGTRLLEVDEAVRLPEVPEPEIEVFLDALVRWELLPEGAGRVHGLDPARGVRGRAFGPAAAPERFVGRVLGGLDVSAAIEGMLEEHPDGPCACSALLAALAGLPVLRDLVMMQFAWGPEFGAYVRERTLVSAEPVEPTDPVVLAFSGGDMVRPDPDRVERGIAAVKRAAACLSPADRAPLLTVAGWLSWTLGRGTIAAAFVDRALVADPAYPFASLLGTMLGAGMLPEWAFRTEPLAPAARAWLPAG